MWRVFIVLFSLVLLPNVAQATCTVVQTHVYDSFDTALPSDVTAGNILLVSVGWYGDGSVNISSISGNSNTFVQATSALVGDGVRNIDHWYTLNATAGSTTISITWSGSTPPRGVHIREINCSGTKSFDKATTEAASSDPTASTLTTANANEIIVTMVSHGNATPPTVPSGYSTRQHTEGGYSQDSAHLEDAGAAGSKDIFWDFDGTTGHVQSNIAFTDAGGGGASKPKTLMTTGVGRPK